MDVILIWLAVCWEIEEGGKMSEKLRKEGTFELKLRRRVHLNWNMKIVLTDLRQTKWGKDILGREQ